MASIDNGSDLGIETSLFKAADKLRGNMEPSDYKHVALGLIFLKGTSTNPDLPGLFSGRHRGLTYDSGFS